MTCLTLVGLLFLVSCTHSQQASKHQLESALTDHLAREGEQCLTDLLWPQDFSAEDVRDGLSPIDEEAFTQVMALKRAGLVSEKTLAIRVRPPAGQLAAPPHLTLRFTLSPAATPYVRTDGDPDAGAAQQRVALCWSQMRLARIVRWEKGASIGNTPRVRVFYLYNLDHVAKWAEDSEIRRQYISIAETLDGADRIQRHVTVERTPKGWKVVHDTPLN